MKLNYEKVYVYHFHINEHLWDMCLYCPALNCANRYKYNTMHLYTFTKEHTQKYHLLI